ncbi:MAG: hypothetical protein ACEQSL_04640 [Sediminibacterium sp.]
MKIVLVLISLRLYEDVIQSEDNSIEKLKLPLVLLLSLSALCWIQDGLDLSALWIYFFVLNHIQYKALGHRNFWAFVLPALQFPMILVALTFSLWRGMIDLIYLVSAISIFLCALVFRWLEQSEERIQPVWIYLFSSIIVAITVLNFTTALSLAAAVVALFFLLILFLFCKRRIHLWWALVVLLLQVFAFNFGM